MVVSCIIPISLEWPTLLIFRKSKELSEAACSASSLNTGISTVVTTSCKGLKCANTVYINRGRPIGSSEPGFCCRSSREPTLSRKSRKSTIMHIYERFTGPNRNSLTESYHKRLGEGVVKNLAPVVPPHLLPQPPTPICPEPGVIPAAERTTPGPSSGGPVVLPTFAQLAGGHMSSTWLVKGP